MDFACFSILLLTIFQTGKNLAIHIEINPETYVKSLYDEVNINCTLDSIDNVPKEIVLIEIVKDEKPIVVIRRGLQPSFPGGNQTRFVVTGHINKDVSLSHLSLTLEKYESSDSGQYSCVMYFLDEIGLVKMEKSSMNLTEKRLDEKGLEKVLKVMTDNLKAVMKKNNDLQKKANTLEEQTKNHSQQITRLNGKLTGLFDKVTFTSAFSATNLKSDIITTKGRVLILPDISMQRGPGYDPNTGVYTAPINGLYVFHVVVRASNGCTRFFLDLTANNKVLARLATDVPQYYDQSSISSVVDLVAGDRVFSRMKNGGCDLSNAMYTVFTGYLIKAY